MNVWNPQPGCRLDIPTDWDRPTIRHIPSKASSSYRRELNDSSTTEFYEIAIVIQTYDIEIVNPLQAAWSYLYPNKPARSGLDSPHSHSSSKHDSIVIIWEVIE